MVQCVAYTPKATVMADYEDVKYYFPEPRDHISGDQNHWDMQRPEGGYN